MREALPTLGARRTLGVNVAGHLNSEKGVGEAVRANIRCLRAAGIPVALHNVADSGSANLDAEFDGFAEGNPYLVNLLHMNADQLPAFISMRGKEYFAGRHNVGYWVWELSEFPRKWMGSFERLDELWVPSTFVQDALSACSPVPVVRIPHALPETLSKTHDRAYFSLPQDAFVFLLMLDFASVMERKNPFGLIEAFTKAFAADDNALLLLKTAHADNDPAEAKRLEEATRRANIRWMDTVLTRPEKDSLLHACDCYVSLHRSEGFGIALAEAMSLGKPVIATGYSGNMDFMSPSNSLLVGHRLVTLERDYGPYEKGHIWADPDTDHAAERMRWVFEHRDQAAEIGRKGREGVARQLGERVVGERMRIRLAGLETRELSEPAGWRPPAAETGHTACARPPHLPRDIGASMSSSEELNATRQIDRLSSENRELRARVRELSNNHGHLELRFQRVENSIVFRFLRWLGGVLTSIGIPVPGVVRAEARSPLDEDRYAVWAEEAEFLNGLSRHSETSATRGLVSIVMDANGADPVRVKRALISVKTQEYADWELLIHRDSPHPDWLKSTVMESCGPEAPVHLISGGDGVGSFARAVEHCRGEFILVMNSEVVLDEHAVAGLLSAADDATIAVYSDWDEIDAAGRRRKPRFTPEFCRELLLQTPYWGRCALMRSTEVRALEFAAGENAVSGHDLALRISERRGAIRRVARMLWHLQDGASAESANPHAVEQALARTQDGASVEQDNGSRVRIRRAQPDARASIVICSRNSRHLRKCLASLQPTLDARHEVIVVAHQKGDGAGLQSVAEAFGASCVPYEGAFHFGVMNQRGVEASNREFLCLLNDDVFPVTPDWLERMLGQAARPDVGMAGALLLYPDGTIQHAGVVVGGWYHPAHAGRFRKECEYWRWLRMSREVTAVTGACMAMRRSVWDELSGFDRRFPVNYNDVDLCLRARERGYRVMLEAHAVLTHEESKTRVPVVRPDESERFYDLWRHVRDQPDRFFNPQLSAADETIQLPAPWTVVR